MMRKNSLLAFGFLCVVFSAIIWKEDSRSLASGGLFFLGVMSFALAMTVFSVTRSHSGEITNRPILTKKSIAIIFVVLCVVGIAIFSSLNMTVVAGLIGTVLLIYLAHNFQEIGGWVKKFFKRH